MAAAVNDNLDKLDAWISASPLISAALGWLEQKTSVKRKYLIIGSIAFLVLYLVFGWGCGLVCNVIGCAYPAYASIKAIESSNKEDDTKWLVYWVVYGYFSIVDFFTDIFLSWFPLYWAAKCIFLTWCFLPVSWNGSMVLYSKVVKPLYLKHGDKVDAFINNVVGKAAKLADAAHKATEKKD